MSTENPLIERYMARFEAALRQHKLPEWADIASDLRSHIAEARSYGKTVGAVLEALGPAEALARAYAIELLMHPPRDARGKAIARLFKIVSILIGGGFVSLIVATTLGSIGVSFVASGFIFFVVGGLEATGVHLPHVQMAGLPPLGVMAIGPVMFAIGCAACWGLWLYARFIARALRRALPPLANAPKPVA